MTGSKMYRAFAAEFAGLAGNNSEGEELMRVLLAKRAARLFESDNPRFDAKRFLAACKVKTEETRKGCDPPRVCCGKRLHPNGCNHPDCTRCKVKTEEG